MVSFARRGSAQYLLLAVTTCLFVLLAVSCTKKPVATVVAGNAACPNPMPIPANFDYPQTAATVENWVNTGNNARARQHGWNLWAALNTTAAGKPVWQTWCTETQAFTSGASPTPSPTSVGATAQPAVATLPMRKFKMTNGLTAGADPINFPVSPNYTVPAAVAAKYKGTPCLQSNGELANGPTLQNNGDVMIAGVIYSPAAYDWIRSQQLYSGATLDSMLPPANQTKQMAAMPVGSIVLKPMLWPVAAGGFTALPLWDDPQSDGGLYAGFEIQKKWPRAAALTTTPAAQVIPASVTLPMGGVTMNGTAIGPLTYQKPRVVGVDQFYNYKPDLATMAPCDRALLDQSAWYAYGRDFRQGDYLVLIAMHVMTKEQPAWTFQSVWWSDRAGQGPYAADRPNLSPTQAPGPWRNYLMANTYGIPASPGGTQWPVAFNPYIELAADHPIRTNCMNCHHRAAWQPSADEYQAAGGPGALDIFSATNAIFNGLIQVDSLWSISDRAQPQPGAKKAAAVAGKR